MGIDGETEFLLGAVGQVHEQFVRRPDSLATVLAHEVAMGACGQVVRGRSVSEMGMDDNPESFQLVQVAIDRRQVDVRRFRLDDGGEILGTVVARVIEDGLDVQAS